MPLLYNDGMTQPVRRTARETFVTLSLGAVLVGLLVFFLSVVSMGVFFHVAAAVVAITLVGYLHYVLWGHGLSQEVAGERAIEKLKDELEAEHEPDHDDRVRRYRDEYK